MQRCTRRNVYEVCAAVFVVAIHYVFMPASIFFMGVCGIGANTWGVKGLSFMLTGSLSIYGHPLPEALLAAGGEIAIGVALLAAQVGIMLGYMWLMNKDKERRLLPYNPDTMTILQHDGVCDEEDGTIMQHEDDDFGFGGTSAQSDAIEM